MSIKRWIGTLFALCLLFGALSGAPSASAASDYDDTIEVGSFSISRAGCEAQNLNTSYYGILNSSSSTGKDTFMAAYNDRLDDGVGWSVGNYTDYLGADRYYLKVTVSTVADNPAYFDNYQQNTGQPALLLDDSIEGYIYMDAQCNLQTYFITTAGTNVLGSKAVSSPVYPVFVNTGEIQYPSGYEGVVIGDGYEVGSGEVKPTFKLQVERKHGVITFRDADDSKDYVYVWTLLQMKDGDSIVDNMDNVTDSGVNEPVSVAEFDVPEYDKYVLGVMMCPVGTDVDDETCEKVDGTGALWITLNINGQPIYIDTGDNPNESPHLGGCITDELDGLEVTHCSTFQESLFNSCVQENFPFIDFIGCTNNIGKLMGLLTFNFLGIGGQFDATPCKQLGVVGDWLNKPGVTVCPKVSEQVRNITTPFITFALGLMMMAFVTRMARERF